jgi:hypothetical protein
MSNLICRVGEPEFRFASLPCPERKRANSSWTDLLLLKDNQCINKLSGQSTSI